MADKCLNCSIKISSGAYWHKANFGFGSFGPFCSNNCKRIYMDARERKEPKNKKQKVSFIEDDYESTLRIKELKLQKELIEKEEDREIAAEKKEKARLKKLKIEKLRAANRPVQARILENSDNLFYSFYIYVIVVFAGYAYLSTKHKEQYGEMAEGNPAKWLLIGSIIIFLAISGFILQKFLKEYFRKETN